MPTARPRRRAHYPAPDPAAVLRRLPPGAGPTTLERVADALERAEGAARPRPRATRATRATRAPARSRSTSSTRAAPKRRRTGARKAHTTTRSRRTSKKKSTTAAASAKKGHRRRKPRRVARAPTCACAG